jgi:ribonuclease BN (tRNA processing enzyme)/DNA-binding response OmpR family regulator
MRVRFWGTRGSISKAGRETLRYGGNTSCVELRSASGTVIVLDCGTGAQGLGQALLNEGDTAKSGHILVSHTHWDHIQGFPFFAPLFHADNDWDIYGPRGLDSSLREALAGQMQYTYSPITLEHLGAGIHYHDLVEGTFEAGDVQVQAQYMNHSALTLGYRLKADHTTVVYATDHEPHSLERGIDGYRPTGGEDDLHVEFVAGADLLIHDAQFTAEEYPAKRGWGHSTLEYVVDVALAAEVQHLALFHHDPMRDDDSLDLLVERARARVADADGSLDVFAATEGESFEVEPVPPSTASRPAPRVSAKTSPALVEQEVLVAVTDPAAAVVLSEAVRADGLSLLVANDAAAVSEIANAEQPSLLLVDRGLPGGDALDICRQIRGHGRDWGADVPFVVIAKEEDDVDAEAGTKAGVTDWLVEPFSRSYARTRIRAWLLRAACRWQCAPFPEDEERRIQALHELGILDTAAEERFDRCTRIAAALFDVPIALVSLVDTNRQWFKSRHGLDVSETPREQAFCAYAILRDDIMVVPDALRDDRFAENPLVTGEPRVRFYAGCPLVLADGTRLGTLCLIDHQPRVFDETRLALMRDVAKMIEREITGATETKARQAVPSLTSSE